MSQTFPGVFIILAKRDFLVKSVKSVLQPAEPFLTSGLEMNELPDLALLQIFGCLPICEQVNIRSVCKLWKHFADERLRSRRELIVFFNLAQMPLFWDHDDQSIDLKNSVIVNRKFKASDYFRETFKDVRSLYIAYLRRLLSPDENLQELVAHYRQLEHLQIKHVSEYTEVSVQLRADFDSGRLRTLFLSKADLDVSFNCPNLRKLAFYGAFHLTKALSPLFKNLEFLLVNSFSYELGAELASLRVISFCDLLEIDIDHFKRLKEIHFLYHRTCFEHDLVNRSDWQVLVVETLDGLLVQKRMKARHDLAVYYDGFLYKDEPEFRSFLQPNNRKGKPICFWNPIPIEHYTGPNGLEDFRSLIQKSRIESTCKSLYRLSDSHRELLEELNEAEVERIAKSIAVLRVSESTVKIVNEPKFRGLFKYTKYLYFRDLTQRMLDLSPEIAPNAVTLRFVLLRSDVSNFRFLRRFRAMRTLKILLDMITFDELKEIMNGGKMFSIWFYLTNGTYYYLFRTGDFEWTLKFGEGKTKFSTKELLLEHLDQTGLVKKRFYERFFENNYGFTQMTFEQYFLDYD